MKILKTTIAKSALFLALVVILRWQCEFPSQQWWYDVAWYSLVLVMVIRPLADLFPRVKWLRKLVPLRKELGILSATIVITAMAYSAYEWKAYFWYQFFSVEYWDPRAPFALGHIATIIAIPLLVTSNKLSMRLLKKNWKRVQRFSHLYFYLTVAYLFKEFHKTDVVVVGTIVLVLTILAYVIKNHSRE